MSKHTNTQELFVGKRITLKGPQVLELLILAGIIVLLLLNLLLRSAAGFSYKLPKFEPVSSVDIQNIRWSQAEGSERNLRKDGEKWYIDEEKYPAKQSYVDTLLEQLSRPALQDLVSKSGNLLTFGLDSERAYKLEAFGASDEEDQRRLYVGKSSGSGRYSFVRLGEDDGRVFTLSENVTSILEKSTDDLRDRLVVSFAGEDIGKLEIRETAGEKSVLVEKKDDKWQIPEDVVWTEEQVNRLVNRFAGMNAQSFIRNYPESDPESDNEYELQFTAKGGVNYTITIGAKMPGGEDDDKGYAAKSSSYGFPFTLNNYTVESMLKDFGFVEEEEPGDERS
ncbi:DUF4340 domain-containing protein [Candidatus Haliotispira prima]|uniref:DUF4340 domain-containing protein n=1 Tax=Candidatus Haliotispira prima TaxID=3034016 RepID=A0ABY8MHR4_9SPIO|nr:DUF4340 domain-containing protein [Candidatus Haliotispira prima]